MRRNVAILIFPEVEVLDFAGPFEVFAVTDELNEAKLFHTFTVAESAATVRARNGLQIVPDHNFASAPTVDILIVPGGFGTRPLLDNSAVLDWVRRHAKQAEIIASVCTGSLVLAKAGLLDGRPATTHYLRHELLRELAPTATVHEDRRFLDSGAIATSAGISAGIDLSLHLVARLHGTAIAVQTARYMEYHWRNDGGVTR
jgi:transcriptional regulator GlxA family with amidase domain